jgi:sugar lactone lactonase YvrE
MLATLIGLAAGPARGAEKVVLVAGTGKGVTGVPAIEAQLKAPFGVDIDRAGNLFVVELAGQRVLRIDGKGILTVHAGTGQKGDRGDGGPAHRAEFNGMHSLAVTANGDLYLADTWNNRVRRIEAATGKISTVAGTGQKGYAGDGGPADQAQFGGIYCVALDPKQEHLYLADLDNRRIRRVHLATGVVATVAGNGQKGVPRDGGDARAEPLVDPRAVAVDRKGNVYILERGGHALRVVDAAGTIRTVAGTGRAGAGGDGGPALQAGLRGPKHLCIDRDDNVLIADTDNHVIRRYLPAEGKIVHVAGAGKKGTGGVGGPPRDLELNQPHGVFLHPSGELYIVDSHNDRVLRIVAKDP